MKPAWISGTIVLAVTIFFGYKIFLSDAREAQGVREQIEQELERGDRLTQLEAAFGVVESYREVLSPEREGVWLIRTVGKLAQEAGVHLSAVNPRRPRHFGEFTQLSVSLRLTASYHQLGHFISRIESAEHFLRVEQLDFTFASEVDGAVGADVDLIISAFYLSPGNLQTR